MDFTIEIGHYNLKLLTGNFIMMGQGADLHLCLLTEQAV